MKLYYSPNSLYAQKVLIALEEKGIACKREKIGARTSREFTGSLRPLERLPMLKLEQTGETIPESSLIIEWLEEYHADAGTRLLPADSTVARRVRMLDRIADFYLNDTLDDILYGSGTTAEKRAALRDEQALDLIHRAYAVFEEKLTVHGGPWLAGDMFSLADCAAAPALGHLALLHPFSGFERLDRYARRLADRPAVKKTLAEANRARRTAGRPLVEAPRAPAPAGVPTGKVRPLTAGSGPLKTALETTITA
ncbi:glutathione S-transferase family protein [Radicibacter daui]|uniref:glutathione S-transferase family protein n=1 Tax=Radicibacter daui TaxID=3064829 RepID=UPI00404698AD